LLKTLKSTKHGYSTNCRTQHDSKQLIVNSSFSPTPRNSANRSPQMAAPNRGQISERFHATQTRVKWSTLSVQIHVYRHDLHSEVGLTASWKRPGVLLGSGHQSVKREIH